MYALNNVAFYLPYCQANFFFCAIKINYSNANRRQMQQNYRHAVCSSITILKHPPTYQNNHSQVLVIISVKITIMNILRKKSSSFA